MNVRRMGATRGDRASDDHENLRSLFWLDEPFAVPSTNPRRTELQMMPVKRFYQETPAKPNMTEETPPHTILMSPDENSTKRSTVSDRVRVRVVAIPQRTEPRRHDRLDRPSRVSPRGCTRF